MRDELDDQIIYADPTAALCHSPKRTPGEEEAISRIGIYFFFFQREKCANRTMNKS